jgi:hypothetical protein
MALRRESAIAGRFLRFAARRFNKIKHRLEMIRRTLQGPAGDHDARAAMTLALMIEGELNFRADGERPLGEKANTLRRPPDLLPDEIDRVGETYRYAPSRVCPDFALDRHNLRLLEPTFT